MNPKPHHRRHRWFSQQNLGMWLAGFALVIVLGLLVLFLWWTNRPAGP